MKKSLVLLSTAVALAGFLATPATAFAENYESVIQQNQQQIDANNKKIEELKQQQGDSQKKLELLLLEMQTTQAEVSVLSNQMQATQAQITVLQAEVDDLTDKIAKRSEKIDEQARYLQTEGSTNDYLHAVFSSDSIVEAFEKVFAMSELTGASQDVLKQQEADKAKLEDKQTELTNQLNEQGEHAARLQELSQEQDNRKNELQTTLNDLQSQTDLTLSENSALKEQAEKAQQELDAYNARVAEQQRVAQQNAAEQARQEEEERRASFSQSYSSNTSSNSSSSSSSSSSSYTVTPTSTSSSSTSSSATVNNSGYVAGSGNFPAPNASYVTSANGGVPGQCTWYVFNRLGQLGITIPRKMGNGGEWASYARSYGYSVSNTPKAGRAVSFANPAPYGHVAFVEAVNDDGSVLVSEMNWVGEFIISYRTLTPAQAAAGQYIDFGL